MQHSCAMHFPMPNTHNHEYDNINALLKTTKLSSYENKEGFVIFFESGYRVKVKYDEYVRLHRLRFDLTQKRVWDDLSQGLEINIAGLPDEFHREIEGWVNSFKERYKIIEISHLAMIKHIKSKLPKNVPENVIRKELAKLVAGIYVEYNKSILFAMYDNKSYKKYIWQELRP
jgi:RNA ligase